MITKALHPSIEGVPRTYLTAKANSGQAVLAAQNVAELVANDFLVIGIPGEELTEIKRIASFAGKNITLSANLVNTHPENTKISVIKYDQVKFYKASSLTGEYSLVSTKDLAIGEIHTLYDDSTAISTDYFKIRYYNSYTADLSVFSDPIQSGGFERFALASIIEALYRRFGDRKKQFLIVEEITDWVNECKDDMVNEIAESNEKHFNGYHQVAITNSSTGEGDLDDTFKKEQSVRVAYDGVEANSVRARRIDIEDLEDRFLSYNEANPLWYFNNYKIGIRPKGSGAAVAFVRSEDHPADLVNDSDVLPKPIRFYLHIVMDYLMMRAKEKDGKDKEASRYGEKYEAKKIGMIEHINNLSLDENREVKDETYDE